LLGKLSPIYLKREADACTNCKICPMGLDARNVSASARAKARWKSKSVFR
jgi:hypothetical protein